MQSQIIAQHFVKQIRHGGQAPMAANMYPSRRRNKVYGGANVANTTAFAFQNFLIIDFNSI